MWIVCAEVALTAQCNFTSLSGIIGPINHMLQLATIRSARPPNHNKARNNRADKANRRGKLCSQMTV